VNCPYICRKNRLQLVQFRQQLLVVGDAFGVDLAPAEDAALVDDEDGAPRGAALFVVDAVPAGDLALGMEVGGEGELGHGAVLGESPTGRQRIDAYAHDLGVLLRKAVVVPLEVAELALSAAGEVGDVPGEDELLAA